MEHTKNLIDAKRTQFKDFLGEFVYGGIDGAVTTFAVVAASAGASLPARIVIIMGLANLIADGFSMSVGEFLSTRSEIDQYKKEEVRVRSEIVSDKKLAEKHLKNIYAQKGLSGDLLESVVSVLLKSKSRSTDEIMKSMDVFEESRSPVATAGMTFGAFQIMGIVPLLPYIYAFLFDALHINLFFWSVLLTGIAFAIIGFLKGFITKSSWVRGIFETLFLGGAAAAVSYFIGGWLEKIVG